MPCNPRPGADDGEDFKAEINAVMSDKSNGPDRSDSKQSGSDLDQLRLVLAVPGPNAQMHEVRKVLAIAQQAYNTTQSELRVLKRQYLMLSAAVPTCSRNCVLKKMSPLDSSISHQGQRYALYCHFLVVNGLFPTTPQPGVDPRSTTHWTSPEAKLKGVMAELYLIIPKDLHQSMETYPRFASLFCVAVSSKRSNILHSIKNCAGVIFSSFKLDLNLFANQPSKKQNNNDLLVLLKRNGEGDYICLAPVLFAKPNTMAADDFLKSVVLIKIVCVEVFGKAMLGGKTQGHPKGRGLCMGTQSVSEGMIAGAAILASSLYVLYFILLIAHLQAHFLLTHDAELTVIGAETKINYQKDYNFYLERLLKGTPWAISCTYITVLPATPRTWEDDFLQELDNLDPVTCNPLPAHSSARAPSPTLSILSTLSASTLTTAVIHNDHPVPYLNHHELHFIDSDLHFGINQLSLANNNVGNSLAAVPAPLTTGSKVPARRAHVSALAAQEMPTGAPKAKRVSGHSKKATMKYTK
ncbi:uncharacterized protein EDB91DRAFT_1251033 [Suillus paluster]|uniref:uncharacterized protein n=1 Tax=Suillus paluster TaxID=48578 RepID=UPI001B86E222|nr:uncharacterized protein EDB91DRAFT_1251033 [Suillus paluster]KAG1734247.1 hypothetical protein EDB91DRAFT_1251033 [Suillus paluster]